MKRRKYHRVHSLHSFEVTQFIREIDMVLPTIQMEEHRALISNMRALMMEGSMSHRPSPGKPVTCTINTVETLRSIIETLRCCGVAPPGWPPPPGPEELLHYRKVPVPCWDGTEEENQKGGQSV